MTEDSTKPVVSFRLNLEDEGHRKFYDFMQRFPKKLQASIIRRMLVTLVEMILEAERKEKEKAGKI